MKTIRELRRERGWTQFDLALAVGVQPQTVYLWERGRRQPQVAQMRRLGSVFEMCSDDIALMPDRQAPPDAPCGARAARRAEGHVPAPNHRRRSALHPPEPGDIDHDISHRHGQRDR